MSEDKEIITGGDFKRMIAGAYSAFLLEYENINKLDGNSLGDADAPGTNMLRTMGAAAMSLRDNNIDNIGAIADLVSSCAILGARGNSGVLLSQIFRGIAKGLAGKYDVTSSIFGRAFQCGILYAHRLSLEEAERPIIITAKAVAKGAYQAVKQNRPISEILTAAINAGQESLKHIGEKNGPADAGAKALMVLLEGCRSGLDGNFVSPILVFSSGTKTSHTVPTPMRDIVKPYCVKLNIYHCQAKLTYIKNALNKISDTVFIQKYRHDILIHLHIERPSLLIDQITSWGNSYDIHVDNMSKPHNPFIINKSFQKSTVLAVIDNEQTKHALQEKFTHIITIDAQDGLCVGNLINAVHKGTGKYILLAYAKNMNLIFYQAQHLLGRCMEVIYTANENEQFVALKSYSPKYSPDENIQKMKIALANFRYYNA